MGYRLGFLTRGLAQIPRTAHYRCRVARFLVAGMTLAGALLVFSPLRLGAPAEWGMNLHRSARPKGGASSFAGLPLSFEPNRGQADSSYQFLAHASGYTLLLGAVIKGVAHRADYAEVANRSGHRLAILPAPRCLGPPHEGSDLLSPLLAQTLQLHRGDTVYLSNTTSCFDLTS